MIRINDIKLPLGFTDKELHKKTAAEIMVKQGDIKEIKLVKLSVDARKKQNVHFNASVEVSTDNEGKILAAFPKNKVSPVSDNKYSVNYVGETEKRPVVVGFGPAGIFAALILAESGMKPVILERGYDCDSRTKTVELFRNKGIFDKNSNIQFGEGGAGTFSDGKLTTGIRDVRIRHVFETFVKYGAPKEILYMGKPHIGTDILRNVIKNMRKEIIRLGGEVIFNAKLTDITAHNDKVYSAVYERDNETLEFETDNIILAIGHSARDTFEKLYKNGIAMAQKSFAMGVRIEHRQIDVNRSLYGDSYNHPALSAADYKYAVHLPNGRSLFTFCMCPGGHVVASASEEETVVTNGMSYFSRNAENANSALLVNTDPSDFGSCYELAGMELQRKIEKSAFIAGGKDYKAPVTLVGDFLRGSVPTEFGDVKPSYIPGTKFAAPESYLPEYITETLREGIPLIAKKADFFRDEYAVLTGPETRSSSPVRILRSEALQSLTLRGLYPCGEGAGYAGGIVSAAVDGIKCAEAIIEQKGRKI